MIPTNTSSWHTLTTLARDTTHQTSQALIETFTKDSNLTAEIAECLFDFHRQLITPDIVQTLLDLARETNIAGKISRMMDGTAINTSENRPALHSALRGGTSPPREVEEEVRLTRKRMLTMATAIREGEWLGYTGRAIRDVVHIGVGGSHLGPQLAVSALQQYSAKHLRIHFVANIDSHEIQSALAGLDPETTLFVVVSKTFTTLETDLNAKAARSWFLERTTSLPAIGRHFIAVTSNVAAAAEFGVPDANLLPMWDWVGGRYSIWSAVGITLAICIGADSYGDFLGGAKIVDQHLASAPEAQNIPILSALFSIWNYNFLGVQSHAVLCYDSRLAYLPAYLQQLEMESNGKSITLDGDPVSWHTMPILWGGVGTQGQHAYHQLLHQGTRAYTADIILIANTAGAIAEHQKWLLANGIAQGEAMANGFAADASEPYQTVAGGHPTTTIILPELTPTSLGVLLACYEHKVLCAGHVWNINSFDQWGVELGKRLAKPIFQHLNQQTADPDCDPVTRALVNRLLDSS